MLTKMASSAELGNELGDLQLGDSAGDTLSGKPSQSRMDSGEGTCSGKSSTRLHLALHVLSTVQALFLFCTHIPAVVIHS